MADFDHAAYLWTPPANQVAFNFPGSTPDQWLEAVASAPNLVFNQAIFDQGSGGGGPGGGGPVGYPIG